MRDVKDIELRVFRDQETLKQAQSMDKQVEVAEIDVQEAPVDFIDGKEVTVPSDYGTVSVTIVGDPAGVPCITCCAVGTDWQICFEDLFVSVQDNSILNALCFYHTDYAGYAVGDIAACSRLEQADSDQESGTSTTRTPDPAPMKEEMMGRIHAVVQYLQLGDVLGFGIGFGGHILAAYANKHPKVVSALICVGLPVKPPRWQENNWGRFILQRNRWAGTLHQMSSRLFSQDQLQAWQAAGLDLANWYHRQLVRLPCRRVLAHLQASLQRTDITPILINPPCRVLLISGTDCHYHEDAVQLHAQANHSRVALQKISNCGLLCVVEDPEQVLPSIELFLRGLEAEKHVESSVAAVPLAGVVVA